MVNSAEYKVLNAHKYENNKKFVCFFWLRKAYNAILPAHKCQNANNCWHFNISEQENFMLSGVEHDFFITSGPGYICVSHREGLTRSNGNEKNEARPCIAKRTETLRYFL